MYNMPHALTFSGNCYKEKRAAKRSVQMEKPGKYSVCSVDGQQTSSCSDVCIQSNDYHQCQTCAEKWILSSSYMLTAGSTIHKAHGVKCVQKNGSSAQVICSLPVAQYTKHMGGVDRYDRNRGLYSVSCRSRRRWPRIFYFTVDIAIVIAYVL
jgi:Transposase IS4